MWTKQRQLRCVIFIGSTKAHNVRAETEPVITICLYQNCKERLRFDENLNCINFQSHHKRNAFKYGVKIPAIVVHVLAVEVYVFIFDSTLKFLQCKPPRYVFVCKHTITAKQKIAQSVLQVEHHFPGLLCTAPGSARVRVCYEHKTTFTMTSADSAAERAACGCVWGHVKGRGLFSRMSKQAVIENLAAYAQAAAPLCAAAVAAVAEAASAGRAEHLFLSLVL